MPKKRDKISTELTKIIELMEVGKSPEQVQKEIGLNHTAFFARLRELKGHGVSWVVKEKKYRIISAGAWGKPTA